MLLDVRGLGDFAAERIAGSINVPSEALELSLESGELARVDRRSIVVAFGSKWPHYEALTKLRGPGRFEAVYAMGGLESWKAANLPVERDEKLVRFNRTMKSAPGRDKISSRPDETSVDVAGLDARALKVLLDARIDLMCIFVGDSRTYEDGHIPGSLHIPASDIPRRMKDVPRDRLVVVFCGCCEAKRGGPSEAAFRYLREMSFARVLHLDGHMHAWRKAGLPVEFGAATLRR
ncbi:MAG TPA: rhodanese-like domain-containing protein [Planctomycetota bacterium]|nr:rhodanese-like domain-containing protein [Planctomycetota bacterium]